MRKIIQLQILNANESHPGGVYALCNDGALFCAMPGVPGWNACLPIPQHTYEEMPETQADQECMSFL